MGRGRGGSTVRGEGKVGSKDGGSRVRGQAEAVLQ